MGRWPQPGNLGGQPGVGTKWSRQGAQSRPTVPWRVGQQVPSPLPSPGPVGTLGPQVCPLQPRHAKQVNCSPVHVCCPCPMALTSLHLSEYWAGLQMLITRVQSCTPEPWSWLTVGEISWLHSPMDPSQNPSSFPCDLDQVLNSALASSSVKPC